MGEARSRLHQDILAQFGANSIVSIAGYYDPAANDQKQHVIVATNDGEVAEFWWKQGQELTQVILAQLGDKSLLSIVGYNDPATNERKQHSMETTKYQGGAGVS